MAPNANFIDAGYNQHQRGIWTQTATIDWCESNYDLTYYIAEFWNTISNLAFILPQLYQFNCLRNHKIIEPAYRRAFLSLALVGLGSFLFHMTLSRPMQMFDETSMILVSLHGFYLLYIIKDPDVNRKYLASLLVLYGLIFLSLYVFLVEWPIFHHTTFALLVYASIFIGYQLKQLHGPHYKFWTVLTMQHSAFIFWLLDKHYCETLTYFRETHVPIVLKPLFQFHAVWHLLMGLGSHIFFCGIIRLRAWTRYKEEFMIRYKCFGFWIVLEKVEPHESPLLNLERQKLLRHKQSKHIKLNNNNEVLRSRRLSTNKLNEEEYDLNRNQFHM